METNKYLELQRGISTLIEKIAALEITIDEKGNEKDSNRIRALTTTVNNFISQIESTIAELEQLHRVTIDPETVENILSMSGILNSAMETLNNIDNRLPQSKPL